MIVSVTDFTEMPKSLTESRRFSSSAGSELQHIVTKCRREKWSGVSVIVEEATEARGSS